MLFGSDQPSWLERLETEHDNLRAALRWLIQKNEASKAARLGIALWHFWYLRSHHLEGTEWLQEIRTLETSTEERAKLLYGLGMLARRTLDDGVVAARLTDALALFRQIEDDYYIASSLRVLGFVEYRTGDFEAAHRKLAEALTLFRRLNNAEGIAVTLTNLGYIELRKRNFPVASTFFEESLAIRRRTGNQNGIANCLDSLGLLAIYQKNYDTAKTLFAESRRIYESLGNNQAAGVPIQQLGSIAYIEGFHAEADALYGQAYHHVKESGNIEMICGLQLLLALTKLQLGHKNVASDHTYAALCNFSKATPSHHILLGLAVFGLLALATEHIMWGIRVAARIAQITEPDATFVVFSSVRDELEAALAALRIQTDHATFAMVWAEGETMPIEEIVAAALDILASE